MRFSILTLFPRMIEAFVQESIIARAVAAGLLYVDFVNIRDFAYDRHQVVDDYPYGGGAGMVMKPDPVVRAIESVVSAGQSAFVIMTTPQGRLFNQRIAHDLATRQHVVIVCGHYEGVDDRVSAFVDDHLSIGDYVLTGGELAAAVILDATARLVPGVINESSAVQESFQGGILEGPQYTRPREFRRMIVPDVLVSGDHERIRLWRRREALRRTLERRPDLMDKATLSSEDQRLLREIRAEALGERPEV